eukprot:363925-Chlamydomonas_euryale.AAC.9
MVPYGPNPRATKTCKKDGEACRANRSHIWQAVCTCTNARPPRVHHACTSICSRDQRLLARAPCILVADRPPCKRDACTVLVHLTYGSSATKFLFEIPNFASPPSEPFFDPYIPHRARRMRRHLAYDAL